MAADDQAGEGGFLRPNVLPSPPPSSVAGTSVAGGGLPRPRKSPLKFGSPKETAFINHVDGGITLINRRYARRNTSEGHESASEVRGYENFKEAAVDLDRLVDLVWVSGTPSLQISYLLSLALLTLTVFPSFPPRPRRLFNLLDKLDMAFAGLILGRDVDSGDQLSGFQGGLSVTPTEKVRIKSLIERTRVAVVELMNGEDFTVRDGDEQTKDQEEVGERGEEEGEEDEEEARPLNDFDMDVARVYDRTLVELGDTLEGPSIGIPGR